MSDSGSGYKGLTIKEKRIRTVDDVTVDESCDDFTYPATKTVFVNEPYVLQSPKDGVIQLDFIFEDYALNKTTKTYYVIRDTSLDASSALKNVYWGYTLTEIGPDGSHNGYYNSKYLYYQINAPSTEFPDANAIINYYMDTNGFRTEKLKFSNCEDKFFRTYTSHARSSTLTYKVEYGYSMNDIITEENPTGVTASDEDVAIFNFSRDVTKDCFVRISAIDDVGNFQSIVRVIPGKLSISSMQKDGNHMNVYIKDIAYKDYNVKEYGAKSFNYLYVYTYQENETSTPTEFRAHSPRAMLEVGRLGAHHSSTKQDYFSLVNNELSDADKPKFFPAGIYKIYYIPCYCYPEVEYFGCFSDPYTLYYNYTPQNQGGQESPELPSSFTITNVQHPANTGYHTASVEFLGGFTQSENFSYGVKYKKQNSSTYGYGDLNFSVRSGSKYDVSIYAKDSNGKIYETDPAYSVELDASYDNIPPSATVDNISVKSSTPNKICLEDDSRPSDQGVGLFVNGDGKIQFDYYLIKKEAKGYTSHDEITRDSLVGVHKNTFCYDPGSTLLSLDWDAFLEGYYVFVMDLKDKNNNSALCSYVVMNITEAGIPKVWVNNSKLYVEALKTHSNYSGYVFWLNNNTWAQRERIHSWKIIEGDPFDGRAYGFTPPAGQKKFAKCAVFNNEYNSLFAYVYPDFLERKKNNPALSCSSKAVIPGLGDSYQVFYDAPCFAHTMAFPTELLAELNSKTNDALEYDTTLDRKTAYTAVWETKGREYGLKLLYGGESDANNSWLQGNTSYIAPVDEIPSGFSYVTVFHFADGTTAMTDVKQK